MNSGFKILGRDPAAVLYGLQSILAALVAFGVFGLTEQSAAVLLTITSGVFALITAAVTRPWQVSLFTGAAKTILTGLVAFGLPVSEVQMGAIISALTIVLGLLLYGNVSPKETALTRA
ncbi:hypothetical protein [Microbispora sp. ATCC PTA-5024]|uniref:hypothetical protein n=1 Tax=Microbispora sp. ATCC PTA-5024 TaxID=316330 RepID=UPI0003DD6B04|nr:hypothetical protein [Microbispora sp. ATCC PTA-5024]ETK36106.1 hypothetical protein MPTA5024_10805 [Microbispora sp. ATCC PTA-5024]